MSGPSKLWAGHRWSRESAAPHSTGRRRKCVIFPARPPVGRGACVASHHLGRGDRDDGRVAARSSRVRSSRFEFDASTREPEPGRTAGIAGRACALQSDSGRSIPFPDDDRLRAAAAASARVKKRGAIEGRGVVRRLDMLFAAWKWWDIERRLQDRTGTLDAPSIIRVEAEATFKVATRRGRCAPCSRRRGITPDLRKGGPRTRSAAAGNWYLFRRVL